MEHQDKGRLELNFVIPHMELQSGKRLQPYYDRADRPRINAWQTLVNHHY
ncbi:nuclease, partial [Klebsiella pneumoniae]